MTIANPATHSAPIPTRMQRLREATREAHMRIEGSVPLLDPQLTLARYTALVAAFFGFYAALEPRLSAAAGTHASDLELGRRGKLPLLLSDLHALGITPARIEALPRCIPLPALLTASHALGVMYVLEGATLGGQVIARNLTLALGVGATNGAAFFAGYGGETRAMWKHFSDYVDRSATLNTEVLVASAVETFEMLRGWLVAVGKS